MEKVTKIAVLLPAEETFSSYYGGAVARWVFEVYSRAPKEFDPTIFAKSCKTKHAYKYSRVNGFSCLVNLLLNFPYIRRLTPYFLCLGFIKELKKYSFIHIHNAPSYPAILRKLGYRGSIYLHLHNNYLASASEDLISSIEQSVNGIIACSSFIKSAVLSRSELLGDKTLVVGNGVDTDIFIPDLVDKKKNVLLFVGRIVPGKGVQELILAYADLLHTFPNLELWVGGSAVFGGGKSSYESKCRSLSHEINQKGGNIKFLGYLNHKSDLPCLFNEATIFVGPSTCEEAFGMVFVEAMACKTSVVSTNIGGIPEVVGDTGVLVSPGNKYELKLGIEKLLVDEKLREDIENRGFERVCTTFSWNIVASKWFEALSLLSK